jgi:hypothetical protein
MRLGKEQTRHRFHSGELGDDFEGIPLVNQKLLPFCRVVHFLGILGDERIKERVESFIVPSLSAENATWKSQRNQECAQRKEREKKKKHQSR